MSTITKYKVLFSMLLMFVAGATSGALVAWPAAKRAALPKRPSMERACDYMKHKLESRLHLTPEQIQKISPRVEQTARELDAVHEKSMCEIEEVFQHSNTDISKELTMEQQPLLVEMEKERREFSNTGIRIEAPITPITIEYHLERKPTRQIMAANKGFPWGKLLTTLIVLGGIGYGAYYYINKPKTKAPQYRTAAVSRGDVVQLVTATGQLEPVINVQVGSQVSGIIDKLYVDYNSPVTNGQLIAKLDPATFQATVDQADGDLANAQASLELAQINAKRSKDLRASDLIPQSDDDNAVANLHQAQATVKIRQAALEKAKVDLSRATIYSTIDGVVISRNVDVGQTVAASLSAPTLFVIANDLRKMQIPAMVSEADVGGIEEGQETTFTVEAFPTRKFIGQVSQVRNQPTTNQNVVTYATMIAVQNSDLKLKPGMTATVAITTAKKQNAFRIPNAALRFRAPETALVKTNAIVAQTGKDKSSPDAEESPGGRPGGGQPSEEQRQRMLARFDKNGDGKLDESERAAMREEMRGQWGAGGGRGGSGRSRPEAQPIKTIYLVSSNIVDVAKGPQLEALRVKTGISDNMYTEIIDGLKEGDVVAVGTIGAAAMPPAAGGPPASNPFGGGRRF